MDIVDITKALSDKNRLRAFYALRKGKELCICQITELLQLTQPTVSTHMSILKRAGFVKSRKEGKWTYYSMPDNNAPGYISEISNWAFKMLDGKEIINKDAKRLKEILKMDKEVLCRSNRVRD